MKKSKTDKYHKPNDEEANLLYTSMNMNVAQICATIQALNHRNIPPASAVRQGTIYGTQGIVGPQVGTYQPEFEFDPNPNNYKKIVLYKKGEDHIKELAELCGDIAVADFIPEECITIDGDKLIIKDTALVLRSVFPLLELHYDKIIFQNCIVIGNRFGDSKISRILSAWDCRYEKCEFIFEEQYAI